jgi:hypothetical protein
MQRKLSILETHKMNIRLVLGSAALAGALTISQAVFAQGMAPHGPPAPPPTAEKAALVDLTGYWTAVVTEDWRWRMLTPAHGDYASVPLNAAGKALADQFNPALYGSGTSEVIDCRAYGAAGVMRMPTHVHITWDNPNELKLETDWGVQTRIFHFIPNHPYEDMPAMAMAMGPGGAGAAGEANQAPSAQGYSVAVWQRPYEIDANEGQRGPQRGRGFGRTPPPPLPGGDLRVITRDLTPGWLRRNGVPYGSHTRLTEYYQTFEDATGKHWFDVTTQVDDPEYLNAPFLTSSDFRQEADGSNFMPHPCKTVAQD